MFAYVRFHQDIDFLSWTQCLLLNTPARTNVRTPARTHVRTPARTYAHPRARTYAHPRAHMFILHARTYVAGVVAKTQITVYDIHNLHNA